jgi:rfaE bifunctional protein kinase chain/domain/rfaE bifunctional protein nucleotidyltransferase chain/domain
VSALLALLRAAPSVEVLVVGDAVLDGWLSGPTTRLSREAPVPVVDVRSEEYAAGGAANTAVNLAALGAKVRFLTVVGDDDDGALLRRLLRSAGVEVDDVLVEPGRRTCAKRRISAAGHMITRYDTGDTGPLSAASSARVAEQLRRLATTAGAVVVSDYGLGVLGEGAVEQVRALAHPCVVVDSRSPLRWAPARPRAVKPNYDEVRPLLSPGPDRAEQVVAAAGLVLSALGTGFACVTLDTDGAVVLSDDGEPLRLHARPQPHDHAAGAGDSFTAALAVGLAAGGRPALAAGLAQAAAQVVVQRRGTTPITAAELRDALDRDGDRLLDLGRLHDRVASHRAAGRSIAFTNGCFDVLHAGHVAHLQEARTLADVLVVGLNSDESVRRLKGPDRPVNSADDRAAVLSVVTGVDHLVVFDTDTAAELLEVVRPDVYVKGGDYTPEMLPEAPLVERLGGRVVVLPYVEDRSTSGLLSRIRTGR